MGALAVYWRAGGWPGKPETLLVGCWGGCPPNNQPLFAHTNRAGGRVRGQAGRRVGERKDTCKVLAAFRFLDSWFLYWQLAGQPVTKQFISTGRENFSLYLIDLLKTVLYILYCNSRTSYSSTISGGKSDFDNRILCLSSLRCCRNLAVRNTDLNLSKVGVGEKARSTSRRTRVTAV